MTSAQFSHTMALQLEEIEVQAWKDLYAAASAELADRLGVRVHPVGSGCLSMVPAVDVLGMNRVFGMGLREPVAQTEIAGLVERYRAAGSRRFFVQVSPYAMPGDLHAWLKSEGFVPYNNWIKLYRSVDDMPQATTDLSIREITEPGEFGSIVAASFEWPKDVAPWIAATIGRPGWKHYMAFDGATPVATGAYFASGEFAWLDLASTLPEARGRGAQSALLARRAADAAAAGCRWLTVETAEETPERPAPSYRNMVRAGFRVAYARPNYLYQLVEAQK
jgi:GNAT superfamily N-acetyltransferase